MHPHLSADDSRFLIAAVAIGRGRVGKYCFGVMGRAPTVRVMYEAECGFEVVGGDERHPHRAALTAVIVFRRGEGRKCFPFRPPSDNVDVLQPTSLVV